MKTHQRWAWPDTPWGTFLRAAGQNSIQSVKTEGLPIRCFWGSNISTYAQSHSFLQENFFFSKSLVILCPPVILYIVAWGAKRKNIIFNFRYFREKEKIGTGAHYSTLQVFSILNHAVKIQRKWFVYLKFSQTLLGCAIVKNCLIVRHRIHIPHLFIFVFFKIMKDFCLKCVLLFLSHTKPFTILYTTIFNEAL